MNKTGLIIGAARFLGSHLFDLFISKVIKILNWQPIVSKEEGLEQAFKYYQSILGL